MGVVFAIGDKRRRVRKREDNHIDISHKNHESYRVKNANLRSSKANNLIHSPNCVQVINPFPQNGGYRVRTLRVCPNLHRLPRKSSFSTPNQGPRLQSASTRPPEPPPVLYRLADYAIRRFYLRRDSHYNRGIAVGYPSRG